MLRYLKYRAKMRWWRLRTWVKVTFSPTMRREWRQRFAIDPCLYNARHYQDYAVMAGFYNDTIPGGFMTPSDAKKIITGERK